MRDAIVARYFGKHVQLLDAAERAGMSADTATNHNGKIKPWRYGPRTTKQKEGGVARATRTSRRSPMSTPGDLLNAKGLCTDGLVRLNFLY
ncbi:hypothetical protein CE206_22785 [Achromobacter xylosoxidans]|nr:hypothetical protein CE206_22785 [Achromobacter xylosoxidans]